MVTIGDKVSEGTYRVHSRFHRVVNFQRGSRLVSVVEPAVGAGPVNIVAEGIDFDAACELRVEPEGIVLDKVRFARAGGKVYRSGIDLVGADRAALRRNLPALKETLLERSSHRSLAFLLDPSRLEGLRPGFERALAAHLVEAVAQVFGGEITRGRAGDAEGGPPTARTVREDGGSPERQDPRSESRRTQRPGHRRGWNPDATQDLRRHRSGNATETFRCHGSGNATVTYSISGLADGVKMLSGCGFGLTPSGDDFLCGMLVGLHVAGRVCGRDFSKRIETIYRAAETENFLSKSFLFLAYQGCVDAKLKALLRGLAGGDRAVTRDQAENVISVGETSGADTLTGLYMTLEKHV